MLQQIRLIVGTMGQLRGDIHYESNTRLYILSFLILIITLRGKFAYPYCPSETDETQVKLLPQPVSDGMVWASMFSMLTAAAGALLSPLPRTGYCLAQAGILSTKRVPVSVSSSPWRRN